MLKASEVMKWVTGLVTSATIIMARNVLEAFSANYRPDLVSLAFFLGIPFA